MNNDLYKKYADLKKQIAEFETQTNELKPTILEDLKERTKEMVEKNLKFEFGTFSIIERKTWHYSEKIIAMEAETKKLKEVEEETGIAKVTVTESLRFQ